MTEKEYRERPEVNKSTLWEIRKSPAHYKWAVENPSEDTPALKMGRAIHMAVLQPEEFPDTYAVMPDGIDRRTKEGKAAWAAWCEENDGKEVLTKEELETCMTVAKSVLNNSNNMLLWCQTEVPLFWVDDRTGIKCKCRIDALKETDDKFLIIDLKTANDASTKTFTREAVKYGYHVQAAHYINGVIENGLNHGKPIEWWFLVVEKKGPYAVNLIKAENSFLDEGQYKLSVLMDKLEECMRVDEYPGYGVNSLRMPEWAIEDTEED